MLLYTQTGRTLELTCWYYFSSEGLLNRILVFFSETGLLLIIYCSIFGGILFSNLWALIKHQNNYYYNAVGASGAVSAVLFCFIFFDPWEKLYLMFMIPIPGILFAVGYLFYSYYQSKNKTDNVAHDAHFLGALFGVIMPILLNPDLFERFIDKLFQII